MKQSNRTAWSYSYKFILFSFENKHTFLGRQWKAHFILTAWFCVLQSFSLVYKTVYRSHTVIWFIKPYSQPVFPLWTAVPVEVCTHESASDSALWMARKYKAPHECWCIETNLLINGCFFHTAVPVHPSCSIMELCYQSIYMFTAIRLMIHGLKTLVQHDAAKALPKDNLCVPATRATADRTAVFDTLLLLSCWAQAAVDTQEQIWRLNMSSYTNTSWNHTESNRLTNRAWCL